MADVRCYHGLLNTDVALIGGESALPGEPFRACGAHVPAPSGFGGGVVGNVCRDMVAIDLTLSLRREKMRSSLTGPVRTRRRAAECR